MATTSATITIGARTVTVTGRAAALLELLAENQADINRAPAGSIEFHFGSPGGQVTGKLVATLRRPLGAG